MMIEEHKNKLMDMVTQIRSELNGAEHYASIAVHTQGSQDSSAYRDMAQQEIGHAKSLCDMTSRWVQSTSDELLHAVWDFEHGILADWQMDISSKISNF